MGSQGRIGGRPGAPGTPGDPGAPGRPGLPGAPFGPAGPGKQHPSHTPPTCLVVLFDGLLVGRLFMWFTSLQISFAEPLQKVIS